MTSLRSIQRVLDVSQKRIDAARRALCDAQRKRAEAIAGLDAVVEAEVLLKIEIAQMTAAAKTAFMDAPQSGNAIERMLDTASGNSRRVRAASEITAKKAAEVQTSEEKVETLQQALAELERQRHKRTAVSERLQKIARRRQAQRIEDSVQDDFQAFRSGGTP